MTRRLLLLLLFALAALATAPAWAAQPPPPPPIPPPPPKMPTAQDPKIREGIARAETCFNETFSAGAPLLYAARPQVNALSAATAPVDPQAWTRARDAVLAYQQDLAQIDACITALRALYAPSISANDIEAIRVRLEQMDGNRRGQTWNEQQMMGVLVRTAPVGN